ncbi:hypothetical protein P5673_028971 [Acropora cervicornis]|uniref:Uncharacterized protein n=1 Tax=Acropora cervicornis TaxID=6130 RepID=A0AAD9UUU4_ACRCE|nr:hypothetical protein P5673_028971 [Acropora cervicornis]
MAPFRWPTTSNDIMLATEVAERKPKSPAVWETIAGILSQAFRSDDKQVDLTGRPCRERLERLINKFKEEDKKSLKKWAS